MSDRLVTKLSGMSDLHRRLQALEGTMAAKAIRGSLGTAMNPVLKHARSTVPRGSRPHKTFKGRIVAPGFLSRSLKKKTRLNKKTNTAQAMIGVSAEAYYGVQYIEKGTQHIAKNPWLARAFESQQSEVLNRFKVSLKKRIERASKR